MEANICMPYRYVVLAAVSIDSRGEVGKNVKTAWKAFMNVQNKALAMKIVSNRCRVNLFKIKSSA